MKHKNKKRLILGLLIFLLILVYMFQNLSIVLRAGSAFISIMLFYFVDVSFNINFKLRHYIYILLMIVAGFLLSPLYFISTNYDKIQHLIMPFIASIMAFYIFDRLEIEFKWKLLITFTSVLSLLVFLEIGEYLIDILFDLKMQGVYLRDISGLNRLNLVQERIDDTMIDMILGVFGSGVFALGKTISYYYHKKQKKKHKKN